MPIGDAVNASVKAGVTFVVAVDITQANNPNVIIVSAISDSDGKCGGLGNPTWEVEMTPMLILVTLAHELLYKDGKSTPNIAKELECPLGLLVPRCENTMTTSLLELTYFALTKS